MIRAAPIRHQEISAKLSKLFDPFGLRANTWFFMDLGPQLVRGTRSWQEGYYSRLKLDVAMRPFVPPATPSYAPPAVKLPDG